MNFSICSIHTDVLRRPVPKGRLSCTLRGLHAKASHRVANESVGPTRDRDSTSRQSSRSSRIDLRPSFLRTATISAPLTRGGWCNRLPHDFETQATRSTPASSTFSTWGSHTTGVGYLSWAYALGSSVLNSDGPNGSNPSGSLIYLGCERTTQRTLRCAPTARQDRRAHV